MVLQLRDGTVVYQGREMDVYDLRERANGPLVVHAEPTFLHRLSDRELKDFGLNRLQIDEGLAEAATARSRRQQSRK